MHENMIPQHFEESNSSVVCFCPSPVDTCIHLQTITWWPGLCLTNGPVDLFFRRTALEWVSKSARSQGKRILPGFPCHFGRLTRAICLDFLRAWGSFGNEQGRSIYQCGWHYPCTPSSDKKAVKSSLSRNWPPVTWQCWRLNSWSSGWVKWRL